jgi:hypothetical protein
MPKNFQEITSAATENVDVACMRITVQGLLHLQRQTVHAGAVCPSFLPQASW